jgi:hypothetical protein
MRCLKLNIGCYPRWSSAPAARRGLHRRANARIRSVRSAQVVRLDNDRLRLNGGRSRVCRAGGPRLECGARNIARCTSWCRCGWCTDANRRGRIGGGPAAHSGRRRNLAGFPLACAGRFRGLSAPTSLTCRLPLVLKPKARRSLT